MEHNLNTRDGLPMVFIESTTTKQVTFASHAPVMAGDVISAVRMKGTVKEVMEERPARGNYGDDEQPTFYRVQLH